jgi:hypothetical protein
MKSRILGLLVMLAFCTTSLGCRAPALDRHITVNVSADGVTRSISVPSGSSVGDALQFAGLQPGELDRIEPPLYVVLDDGDGITLTRVEEQFEAVRSEVPFERQNLRNETLAEGETSVVQVGQNGEQEITYRITREDGVEVSRTAVKTIVLSEAQPEIVMVGARASFTPLGIPGVLAYLAGGNAWVMETSTANRRLLVSTGDLDGRIFSLSPEGEHLIYTRKSSKPLDQEINSLWAVRTSGQIVEPKSLQAVNVVHFAGWIPGTSSVAYSTVEPRSAAPGWQANNDLHRVSVAGGAPRRILEPGGGGVYGWWGMAFAFSPDGQLAYARPDQIGLVDQDGGYLKPLLDVVPLNTHSDWAWIPALAWSPDGQSITYTAHAAAMPPIAAEDSPTFNLVARSLTNGTTALLVPNAGMFSYAAASRPNSADAGGGGRIAYLQAIFPEQSENGRYRLLVMDRDGSNRIQIFPPQDSSGLEPQVPVWAPGSLAGQQGDFIALVFQGNLWLIDSGSGAAYQVTGDRLVTRLDWK